MNTLRIKCLNFKKFESGSLYGRFLINSLQAGQGISLGNMIRRVLLSDIGGTAVSAVRITGIKDEFSTLPGIREDILEILLNIKGLVVKSKTKNVQFGRLKIQGPAIVSADLIELPENLTIVNKTHYIATICTSETFEIEFKFEYGTGYKLINQNFLNQSDGFIQLDTIFMPVQKVNFKIETTYDNSNNPFERLTFEIWTNGSISPSNALCKTIIFVIQLFKSLIHTEKKESKVKLKRKTKKTVVDPYVNLAIEELQLSLRPYNCLKRAQINTVGELIKYSPRQLQKLKNFGRKSAEEVFLTLKTKLGIKLK